MKPVESRKRIEYFDLMKGICIALVVISHCYEELDIRVENEHLWSMLEHLRMPLYFFLSGMFFKEYSCFLDFLVRKTNKLIIPLLFFIVITVFPKLITGDVACDIIAIKKHFTWYLKYGGYLWFLRTLFIANILYYVYNKVVGDRNMYVRIGLLAMLTAVGWCVNSFMPIEGTFRTDYAYVTAVVTSLMVMPFFFVAQLARKWLTSVGEINKKMLIPVFVLSLAICYFSAHGGVYLVNAKVENNLFLFYLGAFSAIVCVWCVSVAINRLVYFSYIGRYSIIVYLTHVPILGLMEEYGVTNNVYVLMSIVLALMPAMVWFFKTLFPAFVAQRDILVYETGRIKFDSKALSVKIK